MNNIRMATIITVRLQIALLMQCVEAVADGACPDFYDGHPKINLRLAGK